MYSNKQGNQKIVYNAIGALFVVFVMMIIAVDIGKKYFIQGIKIFTINSPILFPFLVLLTIFVCFIFEIFSEFKKIKINSSFSHKQKTTEIKYDISEPKTLIYILAFSVLSVIYIYILPKLHFNYATSLYMFSIMIMMNTQDGLISKMTKALLATGITIPIIYYTFYEIFGVVLP